MENLDYSILVIFIAILHIPSRADSSCEIPDYLRGRFYSTDRSTELNSVISEKMFSNEQLGDNECHEIVVIRDTTDAFNRSDLRILFFNRKSNCYLCQDLHYRTPNIIQHRYSSCMSLSELDEQSLFDTVCGNIQVNMDLMTMFRIDIQTINCKTTIEGCYHFTYEVDFGGGSICDSPQNVITACQRPGSVYVDNQVFDMSFGECPDVASSIRAKVRFQCMGTWKDADGNVFSAVADIGQVPFRDRFRCLLTRFDQQMESNERRFSMSRWASCAVLQTPYDGDIRIILSPTIYNEIPSIDPGCRFPRNFTGSYYAGGEYDNTIIINTTHISKETVMNQYEVFNSFFICLAHVDSRYLTFTIDEGKCETHFVCYDFLERHHSIIRFRMGKPVPARLSMIHDQDYMVKIFRETCTWSTFTYERKEEPLDWIYFYYMMNPPSPVPCPIGGRYTFTQEGSEEELYKTEVGGMTERPRHTIDCREDQSELKSCDGQPSKMTLDVSYCASLDHTGRPIGEYDIPDRELICVGYWMENMRSYLLTFDLLDPVSNFRCWVYERVGWRDIHMSRSSSAHCDVSQTATSNTPDEGSSLKLVLRENERLFDECSQRYDTGENPWQPVMEVFILDSKVSSAISKQNNCCHLIVYVFIQLIVFLCIYSRV